VSPHSLTGLQFDALNMPNAIAVAWSGGADSTALLWLLREHGYAVQAWHINHQWSEQSTEIAALLAERAKAWGISFTSLNIKKPNKNKEALSRQGRYTAFVDLSRLSGCHDVALAHHLDDQAETVCMRMLQGAGVAGCQGMLAYRQRDGLNLWRPLLSVSRADIEAYLKANDIPWVHDVSNDDTSIWRNKIRHQLFAQMREAGSEPQHLFLRWQEQAVKQQQAIQSLAKHMVIERLSDESGEAVTVNWHDWCSLTFVVRVYVLQQMMGMLFAEGRVLGRRHLLAIEAWRLQGGNSWLNLPSSCLYRRGQGLQLCQGKVSLRNTFAE